MVALAALVLAGTVTTTLSAQAPSGGLPIDTIDLAGTTAGVPLSFKQVVLRTRHQADGSSAMEETTLILYRDSAGRVRSEQEGGALSVVRDPVGRQAVYLLRQEKRAIRVRPPDAATDVNFSGGSLGPALLPSRVIAGVECEGMRWTYVDPGNPDRTAYRELWESRPIGVIVLASVSVPGETFTARIENLVRGEPDPALFAIPRDFAVTELQDQAPQNK
jgi:hypothetical protein